MRRCECTMHMCVCVEQAIKSFQIALIAFYVIEWSLLRKIVKIIMISCHWEMEFVPRRHPLRFWQSHTIFSILKLKHNLIPSMFMCYNSFLVNEHFSYNCFWLLKNFVFDFLFVNICLCELERLQKQHNHDEWAYLFISTA